MNENKIIPVGFMPTPTSKLIGTKKANCGKTYKNGKKKFNYTAIYSLNGELVETIDDIDEYLKSEPNMCRQRIIQLLTGTQASRVHAGYIWWASDDEEPPQSVEPDDYKANSPRYYKYNKDGMYLGVITGFNKTKVHLYNLALPNLKTPEELSNALALLNGVIRDKTGLFGFLWTVQRKREKHYGKHET